MNPSPQDNRATRGSFLESTGSASATTSPPGTLPAQIPLEPVTLKNDQFELLLVPGQGLDCILTHLGSGTVLAQGPYFYSMGTPVFEKMDNDGGTVTLVGKTETDIEVSHTFRVQPKEAWLEEEITIRNVGTQPYHAETRCGFTLPSALGTLDGFVFTAVPFRREPSGAHGQYADYSLNQILHEKRASLLRGRMNWTTDFEGGVHETSIAVDPNQPLLFDVYASEGWALTNGKTGFLLTKYNPLAMEWTILDPMKTADTEPALRWGGAGIYAGDPEPACGLQPGASFHFGTTTVTPFAGDLTQGFYTFRAEMESRGHKVPDGFNAPLHWNELYDNKLWWLPHRQYNDPEKKKQLYLLKDMEEEEAKAQAIGCEALYLDPGWDVSFASKIWDESRLGPLADFVAVMESEYGLKVSLHTPLSGWCDPMSYPFACCRIDQNGQRDRHSLCGASDQYVQETGRRLDALGKAGVTFFMFDGTAYNGPCWDPQHGHAVPSRRHDHVRATNQIAGKVHEKYPDVLIEMHDQVLGPRPVRYVPTYFGYGRNPEGKSTAPSFDTIWAYELMWDPMHNLGQGNSVCLYYYNLAYSQPLYLHIDLRSDNAEAVMFWWNASTCRHLGIGGTHDDPKIREAQKRSVAAYLRLKPHFASGIFYGMDETTHVHRHPTAASAVINCFNLEQNPIQKRIEFDPVNFGLPAAKTYNFTGATFNRLDSGYTGTVTIPPMGHRLVEISS